MREFASLEISIAQLLDPLVDSRFQFGKALEARSDMDDFFNGDLQQSEFGFNLDGTRFDIADQYGAVPQFEADSLGGERGGGGVRVGWFFGSFAGRFG